jgi:tetrahydromethanopterin S-methyltransferase subunit A
MEATMITNFLMMAIFGLIAFVSNIFLKKIDRFEKKIEQILMSDVAMNKDIEVMKSDINNHETRIIHLETK